MFKAILILVITSTPAFADYSDCLFIKDLAAQLACEQREQQAEELRAETQRQSDDLWQQQNDLWELQQETERQRQEIQSCKWGACAR
jgi:hypothetical protein